MQREKKAELWRTEIGEAIKACDVMIWIMSGEEGGSLTSQYCIEELSIAEAFQKSIFPVLGTTLEKSISGSPAAVYLENPLCETTVDLSKARLETAMEDLSAYDTGVAQLAAAIRYRLQHPKTTERASETEGGQEAVSGVPAAKVEKNEEWATRERTVRKIFAYLSGRQWKELEGAMRGGELYTESCHLMWSVKKEDLGTPRGASPNHQGCEAISAQLVSIFTPFESSRVAVISLEQQNESMSVQWEVLGQGDEVLTRGLSRYWFKGNLVEREETHTEKPEVIVGHPLMVTTSDTFHREWKKGSLLGRGAFGSVHKALCGDTGETIAVKEILYLQDSPKEDEIVTGCEEEIKILKCLSHPNIVQYLGTARGVDTEGQGRNRSHLFLEFVS